MAAFGHEQWWVDAGFGEVRQGGVAQPVQRPARLAQLQRAAEHGQLASSRVGAGDRSGRDHAAREDLRSALDVRQRRAQGGRERVRAREDHGHQRADDRAPLRRFWMARALGSPAGSTRSTLSATRPRATLRPFRPLPGPKRRARHAHEPSENHENRRFPGTFVRSGSDGTRTRDLRRDRTRTRENSQERERTAENKEPAKGANRESRPKRPANGKVAEGALGGQMGVRWVSDGREHAPGDR